MRNILILLLTVAALPSIARAQTTPETIEYYGTDMIGSIRIVFRPDGTTAARQDYAPFGRPFFPVPAMPRESFGAQEKDEETDQSYFHARMFQDRTGRFTRVDPRFDELSDPQRLNRYTYVLANPLRLTDASGMTAKDDIGDDDPMSCASILRKNPKDFWCGPSPDVSTPLFSGTGTHTGSASTRRDGGRFQNAKNTGPNVIFAKPEKGDTPVPIAPGETYNGPTDGIADPCGHPGMVFKNVTLTDVVFSPTVTVAVPSTVTFVLPPAPAALEAYQQLRGGWKGDKFRQQHADWHPLFAASNDTSQCK